MEMTHKEAIQAMLDGETLQFKMSNYVPNDANNYLRYDENLSLFVNTDDEEADINDLDLTMYRIKPKRWRADKGKIYWYINSWGNVDTYIEDNMELDMSMFELGNYFKTKEEAEAAVVALRKFWKEYTDA